MAPSWYNNGLNIYLSGDCYNNAACRNVNYITQAGISNMNNLTSGGQSCVVFGSKNGGSVTSGINYTMFGFLNCPNATTQSGNCAFGQ
jgi:hypothetical protein